LTSQYSTTSSLAEGKAPQLGSESFNVGNTPQLNKSSFVADAIAAIITSAGSPATMYEIIKDSHPIQGGNVELLKNEGLNTVLFVAMQDCEWSGLLFHFGGGHSNLSGPRRTTLRLVLSQVANR
jgi:hypothetical protein